MKKVGLAAVMLLLSALLSGCSKAPKEPPDSINNACTEAPIENGADGYDSVLERYRLLLSLGGDGFPARVTEFDGALESTVINAGDPERLGYAIYDINGDGSPELFLLDENYCVYAIFSRVGGKSVLLDSFGKNNHYVAVGRSGTIYKTGYGKGETRYTRLLQVTDCGELKCLLTYGYVEETGADDSTGGRYYVTEDDVTRTVEETEIRALDAKYDRFLEEPCEITKTSGLQFVRGRG